MLLEQLFFVPVLLCSVVSGYLIGYERRRKGKSIGSSTVMLVVLAAASFSFVSALVDPMSTTRIAANVLTGVAFLCAGVLVKDGKQVTNLTTSVALWTATAIGLAYGYQLYLIGILLTIADLIICNIKN